MSFAIDRGEIIGLLGPNGAGKTTTMRMIAGYLRPSSGTVRISGYDSITDSLAAREKIGFLPEGAPLHPDMTPLGFLRFIAGARRLKDSRTPIAHVVDTCRIQPVLTQPIETLSKGYRRRVGLAQALLADPEVLILDEPTDGLDPLQKHEVHHLLRGLASEKAIIISTHLLDEVEILCDRVIIIAEGRVVADCTPSQLCARTETADQSIYMTVPAERTHDLTNCLRSFDHVIESTSHYETKVKIAPRTAESIKDILAAISQSGLIPLELHIGGNRLETIFLHLTGKSWNHQDSTTSLASEKRKP